MSATAHIPPFRSVATALRDTTERLAAELRAPGEAAPDWNDFEWDVARAAAAMQGISALLAHSLKWRGPEKWQAFLREQSAESLKREQRIDELLPRIDAATRRENVGIMLLKGAAIRAMGIYPPGVRPMGDLDLLARPADFPAATRALQSLGFNVAYSTRRDTVFTDFAIGAQPKFGEHTDNPVVIELHPNIYNPIPFTDVDITARMMPGVLPPGTHHYPNLAALLAHVLLRVAGNMCTHCLRLAQVLDIAKLTPLMRAADWQQLLTAQDTPPWWGLPPLLLAQRYCDAVVPPDVLATLSEACPRFLLRAARRYTLTEVTWSNLRIPALPGLVWSRSIGEAALYARTRMIPHRSELAEMATSLKRKPQFFAVPWYGLSHAKRISRWIFGRPPRVQAMTTVMAALSGRDQFS
jgi:hypothetical protein